ncbi:MAG: hypothetical protein JWM47_4101 [Acidimicrobiales bacterium]|nr:hypothetical protein [Acidimicrobiales bacterium]
MSDNHKMALEIIAQYDPATRYSWTDRKGHGHYSRTVVDLARATLMDEVDLAQVIRDRRMVTL